MEIKKIVETSSTYKECLNMLGWNINGTNYAKLKVLIKDNNLSIKHFLTSSDFIKEVNFINRKYNNNEMFIENSEISRGVIKKRIIKDNLLKYECVMCGSDGNWLNTKFSLILDHINGVNNDNRLENLRFLCPNCNATLETHCGGNVKNKKNKKINKTKEELLEIRKLKRKVERPPLEELIKEIETFGYSATGRKYGVSDNAIRKWVKNYLTP